MALTDQPRPVPNTTGTRHTTLLIAGDVLAFGVFAVTGLASHGLLTGNIIARIGATAAPFLIGWFAAAPFAGAFKPQIMAQPRAMLGRTAVAWVPAWLIGLALRALIRNSGVPPVSFAIVTFLTVLCILGGWRLVFAWVQSRQAQPS